MDFVKLEIKGGIATITLDRPEKLNALNAVVLNELEETFQELKGNEAVRVIVVTGAGEKSFVAGADITQFPSMSPEEAQDFAKRGQTVFSLIESSSKPVLAAINGFALGGGCELALSCHLRFASDNALFGQPEVKLGVIAGYGGTQRLPRLIGRGRALDLLLSGRMIKADEALQMGLVNGVFPQAELLSKVEEYAEMLMAQGPKAQALTLRAVYQGIEATLIEGLEEEASAFRDVFKTEDRIEGATAFIERRPPKFRNR
ncbi:MAG: enoyl-CoA hydratase/isomerase family protein [FCB group bacterium]|nr:enoyl-CoA hydratase/isomerase family protein [FCB group bacterium]MBL7028509.1 enoyl-CoA hydratase/isomerase family protein [Candidatus Neomarinimicrobiota bacterium]MBL7121573.1 enoyl-CoA hydratase/isomerase family protein [Candidatus Neomarinimicrobiota bacterium]